MGTASTNLLLGAEAFSKCRPNLSTNIAQCGTVTLCNAKPATQQQLSDIFTVGGEYRVMSALIKHEMEIKMCEAKQETLYDFFMSNKLNFSKKLQTSKVNNGLIKIAPFVLARQYSQINDAYWLVSNGQASGGNWQVDVTSSTNIPLDVRTFLVDERVFIDGANGSTKTRTAWKIVSSTLVGAVIRLVLASANAGSYLPPAALGSPITGVLTIGTANKDDYEKFCAEPAAYLNWKNVPFWVETMRTSMCRSELYDKWRALLLADNPLYAEFGDLDEIERNKQLARIWQRKMLNQMMWGKKSNVNQTMGLYDSLPEIDSYAGGIFDAGGAKCEGRRADMVGIYEQLVQCGRVFDAQGAILNLPALFNELYNIMRVRDSAGRPTKSIDLFMTSVYADTVMQALIKMYNAKSDNTFRMTLDVNAPYKDAEFGFRYREFKLGYPNGLVINLVTHYYFDDYQTAMTAAGLSNAGNMVWILDMAGIYPGIINTRRVTNKTGDLKTLAAIDNSYACVMAVRTQEQTLTSVTMTMVVECPMGCLILENLSPAMPEPSTLGGVVYPATTTTTTTTSTSDAG